MKNFPCQGTSMVLVTYVYSVFSIFHSVPPEIKARGSAAESAYKFALLEGKVKVHRARLLIIGQDRAGKTSLKKSLIGLPFNPKEPSTEVLEKSSSKLEVNIEQVVEWKAISDDSEAEQVQPQHKSIARLVVENMMKKKEEERDVAGPAQVCHFKLNCEISFRLYYSS